MSQNDDNQIQNRLKALSQIGPSPEASNHALQKVRDTIGRDKFVRSTWATTWGCPYGLVKLAAAAVILISAAFLAGRLSAPRPLNVEALQASLEPAIRRNILAQINEQWQKEYASKYSQIKDELVRQMSREMGELAEQTLAASSEITDQRMKELIQLVEAARTKDRQWIAAALEQIELNRRQDNARLGGLVTLAAQTNQSRQIEQN